MSRQIDDDQLTENTFLDNLWTLACHGGKERRGSGSAGPKLSASEIRQLHEQHGAALLLYARSFAVAAAVDKDLVHEVFLKRLRGEITVPDIPLAYLHRAVRNAALNALRDKSDHAAWDHHITWFQHREGKQEEELALQSALGELPEDQRATVIMRIWGGMTLEEIAQAMAVPLSTTASRYRYALERLRQRLMRSATPPSQDPLP